MSFRSDYENLQSKSFAARSEMDKYKSGQSYDKAKIESFGEAAVGLVAKSLFSAVVGAGGAACALVTRDSKKFTKTCNWVKNNLWS